jgi:hypothetical protein
MKIDHIVSKTGGKGSDSGLAEMRTTNIRRVGRTEDNGKITVGVVLKKASD